MHRTRAERRRSRYLHKKRDYELWAHLYVSGMRLSRNGAYVTHPGRGSSSKYLKTDCARAIRRLSKKGYEFSDGSHYKKVTEFWWRYE